MSNESNQPPEQPVREVVFKEPEPTPPVAQEQLHRVAQAMAVAAHGVRAGAADARLNAQAVAAGASRVISKTVYATCYYISYGVVFPTLLLASVLPTNNAFGHGFIDGANAASDAVNNLKAQKASREAEALETGDAVPAMA